MNPLIKNRLLILAVTLGIVAVSVPIGVMAANVIHNQNVTACYEYGRNIGREVKAVGDVECFEKRDNQWERANI